MDDADEQEIFMPSQYCIAIDDFTPEQDGDLGFKRGEYITIIESTEAMHWYKGKNSKGEVGTVPGTFLKSKQGTSKRPVRPPKPEYLENPAFPSKPAPSAKQSALEGYERMGPGGTNHNLLIASKETDESQREIMMAMAKEKQRRLSKGTLVVAIAKYEAQCSKDLSFELHEEMVIIEPMAELCWYIAHKVDCPSAKGVIPITHVRLVYMSDDEDEGDIYQKPKLPGHDKLYDDTNDFINQSGWYTFPGLALGKTALLHVFATKANMSYEDLLSTKQAVYCFKYKEEKVFVGKADILHEALLSHFDCFGKAREKIREIDDELCHHTDASGWKLNVWPISSNESLEVECAKRIREMEALRSTEGIGINEEISFTDIWKFEEFWDWYSPN